MNIFLENMLSRYPSLKICVDDIEKAFDLCCQAFTNNDVLFTCGNGGSASDADHICGELLKGFLLKREIPEDVKDEFVERFSEEGEFISERLQRGLKAVSLTGHPALSTAFANDVEASLIFAQQMYALGNKGDVVIGLSTSGNADNIYKCFQVAAVKGVKTILLTGRDGGKCGKIADISIIVPEEETYKIQELHLPIYHTLCLMLEDYFYGEK
jgi:D-sedoheptulose 7-phosphate isomerase